MNQKAEPVTSWPGIPIEKPTIWIKKMHRKKRWELEFELPFGFETREEMCLEKEGQLGATQPL